MPVTKQELPWFLQEQDISSINDVGAGFIVSRFSDRGY